MEIITIQDIAKQKRKQTFEEFYFYNDLENETIGTLYIIKKNNIIYKESPDCIIDDESLGNNEKGLFEKIKNNYVNDYCIESRETKEIGTIKVAIVVTLREEMKRGR